ncbi:MAG: NAD(P)H-dependent oxidoreductase [Butyribacter sp.]|nr:NAD(P)H-dependent oxidoreductase [Butyribacter sp.]
MKVVMIHGQNHKGSTYHVGRMLADQIAEESEITEFFLPRDLNHHCLGCYACIEEETKCPFYKEKKVIADAMDNADILVFTTPNYCMAPSGPMKAFIDLFFQYWMPHRPRKSMFSKKAVVISTTAGTGAGKAISPIKRTLAYWGVPYIKTYGIAVQASNWYDVADKKKAKIEHDMTALAKKVKKAKTGKPSLYIRFMFHMMATVRKKNPDYAPSETLHWKSEGLLDNAKPWKKA